MIFTLARRGMLAHKRRLVGLMSAIALGVAFLTGTLVLGDTMRASFNDVFAAANAGVDAAVQGTSVTTGPRGEQKAPVPADLVAELRALPGVRTVQPSIDGIAQIVGSDDTPIGGTGPPTLGSNWIDNPELNPQRIAQGRAPAADDEVVIDSGSAETGRIAVGDKVQILLPEPRTFTVVGLTKYGDQNSLGGTTYVGMTDEAAAQYLAARKDEVTSIVLQAAEGVSPEDLVASVQPLLPRNTEVITGAQLTEQQNQEIQGGFLNFFTIFLTIFAVIAVVVSTFSIYNTFSVITAQKSRESALLRAVGASRGQVLRAVAGESLLIGVVAAALGTALGVGVAAALVRAFQSFGAVLESAALVVTSGALLAGFLVGITVTFLAAIAPAVRASRVAPLAALRDVAVESGGRMPIRATLGGLAILGGAGLLATLVNEPDNALLRAGAGAALAFVGFLIFGPVAARPVARVIGTPIGWVRGIAGRMATANAIRNPRRTAATATALMVGVAIVAMFTIFANSIKAAITDSFVGDLNAELTLSSTNFSGAGFDPAMLRKLADLPGVAAVSTLDSATALLDGTPTDITIVDIPGIQAVTDLGDQELPPNALAIDQELAAELGLADGDEVSFGLPNGQVVRVEIGAIYQRNNLVRGLVVPRSAYQNETQRPEIYSVFLKLRPGASEAETQAAAQLVADDFKAGTVQTREQFADDAAGQIDQLLGIIYALLVLAIVIALIGIANTLSLSVFERTRELGLLRAVGQTRGQLRAMVRWESVIIAVFGTVGGIGLGVLLGWAVFVAAASFAELSGSPSIPVTTLLIVAAVGAAVGMLAGWRPAARAAKLNVLAAIATE